MKKFIPHFLIVLLVAAIATLVISGGNPGKKKILDERITLRKSHKLPYGTWVAWKNLEYLFPGAEIVSNRYEPGYWNSISMDDTGQVFISITDKFTPDKSEMTSLIEFAANGNDVFISAMYISAAADKLLNCSSSSLEISQLSVDDLEKGANLLLSDPPFGKNVPYKYPGRTFRSYFTELDTATTNVLGRDDDNHPNFIHLRTGTGNFYVHLEPLAFSNYFLLHKKNISYYESIMSLIKPDAKKVVWDEYYLNKKEGSVKPQKKQGWFNVFLRYPSLRAALLTALFALLIYVLMEMRRKQRPIPVVKKPKNDSLDFVKTIGRLYYEKGDHKNLCRKMSSYFLEHVRNRYKLPTGKLDDEFVDLLHYKSGVNKNEIKQIVYFIKYVEDAPVIDDKPLSEFHRMLESFYNKT